MNIKNIHKFYCYQNACKKDDSLLPLNIASYLNSALAIFFKNHIWGYL